MLAVFTEYDIEAAIKIKMICSSKTVIRDVEERTAIMSKFTFVFKNIFFNKVPKGLSCSFAGYLGLIFNQRKPKW
jgi:hypothetical protein